MINNESSPLFYLITAVTGIFIVAFFWIGGGAFVEVFIPSSTEAATSSAVTVTATVSSVISCSSNITSTDFGALSVGAIATAGTNGTTTISCENDANGCTLYVKDAGGGGNPGLWNSGDSAIIGSADASYGNTATLVAGTAGYGIQVATSTGGSGANLALASRYNKSSNDVGGFEITNVEVASSTSGTTSRTTTIVHKAAIASSTVNGSYADTITYSCTSN